MDVQWVEPDVVVGELALDSVIVGPQEPVHVKVVETVLVPQAVVEVEAATGVGLVAGAVPVSGPEVEAGHRAAGIVEL